MGKQKLKNWAKRYLPAELVGTITAVAAASIFHLFYSNLILTAYVGSMGETIGFFGTIVIQNLWRTVKKCRIENRSFAFADFRKISSSIALEFGPAIVIDDLLVRPFFMVVFPMLLNNFTLGIFLGKVAGDITFYLLVIVSYELKQWILKTKWSKN